MQLPPYPVSTCWPSHLFSFRKLIGLSSEMMRTSSLWVIVRLMIVVKLRCLIQATLIVVTHVVNLWTADWIAVRSIDTTTCQSIRRLSGDDELGLLVSLDQEVICKPRATSDRHGRTTHSIDHTLLKEVGAVVISLSIWGSQVEDLKFRAIRPVVLMTVLCAAVTLTIPSAEEGAPASHVRRGGLVTGIVLLWATKVVCK